jgi:hypothetical protein
MKNNLLVLIAALFLLILVACPKPRECAVHFELNKSFRLDQAATACAHDDKGLSIRFDSIRGDSRCPEGVQCIWAGRADAVLTLSQGENSQTSTLSTGDMSQGGAGETTFNGFTVKLENVEPPAKQGQKIEQKDYKVRLLVMQ